MRFEVGLIAAGVPVGFLLRKKKWALRGVDKLLTWSVRLLLFFLGLSLGADEALLDKIDILGVRAVAVSACAVLGSMVAVWLVRGWLYWEDKQ